MQINKKYIVQLGFFISIAFVIFLIAIYFIGQQQSLFKPTVKITTVFRDVKGLKTGNNVRFTGIDIGTVINLTILSDTSVRVEMSLDKNATPFIKKNSFAAIGTEGVMGNKIIVILPGTIDEQPIRQGDNIRSIEPIEIDDIIRDIKLSSEKISIVSENLIGITDKINQGEGIIGKLFTDTSIMRNLDRTIRNLSLLSNNLVSVSRKIDQGNGLFGKFFTDTLFSRTLDSTGYSFKNITQNIEGITDKINQGKGVFGRLFTDTTFTYDLYRTSQNLQRSSSHLLEVSERMNTTNSLFNRLISDPAFADSVDILLNKINIGVNEATEASKAIQKSGLIRMFSKKEKEEIINKLSEDELEKKNN